jgi:HPt (histidine-containing phosphotransfer) domain-containing protein
LRPITDEIRQTPETDREIIDQLMMICEGDDAFSRELTESFLESALRSIAGVYTALDLRDSVALAAQSHALRGISATIGARDLAALCADLEDIANQGDLEAAVTVAARLGDAWERVRTALEQLFPTGSQK